MSTIFRIVLEDNINIVIYVTHTGIKVYLGVKIQLVIDMTTIIVYCKI